MTPVAAERFALHKIAGSTVCIARRKRVARRAVIDSPTTGGIIDRGVAATVGEVPVRGIATTVLEDGGAGFGRATQKTAIAAGSPR